jgi:hypothetical protein
MMLRMAPAAIAATPDYVYVVRGNTLYQFDAKDLKLLNKATLEEDERPFAGRLRDRVGGAGQGQR